MFKIYNLLNFSFISILLISCSSNENLKLNREKNQDSCKINLNDELSYINNSPCFDLPFGSSSNLVIKKFDNGQLDLRNANILDKKDFFGMNYLEDGEVESAIVARIPAKNNQVMVVIVNNNNMESEGYAQTYNIFSLDKGTGKIIGERLYNVGFSKFVYNYDITSFLFERKIPVNLESIIKIKDYDEKCVKDFFIDKNYSLTTEYLCVDGDGDKKNHAEIKKQKMNFVDNNFRLESL